MDLRKLAITSETHSFNVKHPATDKNLEHEGRSMTIEIYGSETKVGRKALVNYISASQDEDATKADIENAEASFYTEITVSGQIFMDGKWFDLSKDEDKKEFYSEQQFPWLIKQINVERNEIANFMQKEQKA